MKTTWLCALLLLASPILGAPAPFGEDPRSDLTEISASLKDIARTLKQQAEMQKSDLMLKRVTLASTQLSVAQETLRRIERETGTQREISAFLDTNLKKLQAERPLTDVLLTRIAETKTQAAAAQDRLTALNLERVSAENEVEALRREVKDWQRLLDKMLTGAP